MITPTGRTIEIAAGPARAVIGTVAAVLRGLVVDGVALTEPTGDDDHPRFANGIVLAPWPNRVRDGRWQLDGEVQQLAITEPERGNAIHGLLRFADYAVRERSEDAVVLGAIIPPQPGWPALVDTWVEYRVVPDGLVVRHSAVNRSRFPTPYAVGAHPFLRIGDAPVAGLRLTVRADTRFETDERLLPVAERAVDGTMFDLRGGVLVGDVAGRLDTAFGGLRHGADGEVARLQEPESGRWLALRQDADWRYLQVFTPTAFPGAEGRERPAIAIEPMTAPPDALRSGEGLVRLEPGIVWSGGWALRSGRV